MDKIYHVLIVEDLPSDVYFVQRETKKVIENCIFECVETREDFLKSLHGFKPDIILSDFSLPGFDWRTAFSLAREQYPRIPFVIVTGSTSPKIMDECMSAGVTDCISKLHIKKLGPVILRELNLPGGQE
jgi:CheY-like chemotaxis protein